MVNQLRLVLLGKPQFTQNGTPVAGLNSVKAQALLAYLAVTRQAHSRSALAGLLWSETSESAARTSLRAVLSQLRKAIGPYLTITRRSVALSGPPEVWLDVAELEAAVAGGVKLRAAANLYRDDFLADFYVPDALAFEDWALIERERLRQLAVGVLHRLVDEAVREGDFATGIQDARRILTLEAWREEAHQQLMGLLADSGQRSAALAQYETCRQLLAQELGVEPSAATTALYEEIKTGTYQSVSSATNSTPAEVSPPDIGSHPHNLPAATTSFVGREAEQTHLNQLLADHGYRLLTIIGPGGIGKTRLALSVALAQTQTKSPFTDGVFFVPLSAARAVDAEFGQTPNPIILAIAEAMGLTFSESQPARKQLLDALWQKSMLLVLDNFEHLTDYAELLVEILEQSPGVKIMATSREALNLYEELIFDLRGLAYPSTDATDIENIESVQLFVQRARRVYLEFDLSVEQTAVARICRLLEGMPLGIELAAAWVRTLSCHEIMQEIQRNLDFLAATVRNVPDRQRSLRAAFEYSWQLLSRSEQEIFSKLTIFRGGFSGQAAAAITGASLRTLSALVDKSLLHRTVAGRYALHELLRQHGREKLNNAAQVQAEHARFFANLMHRQEESLIKGYTAAISDVAAEIDNLRAAWEWSVANGEVEFIDRLLDGLASYYELRGWFQEGQDLIAEAVQRLDALATDKPALLLLGRVQQHLARFFDFLGHFEQAREHAQKSLNLFQQLEATTHEAGALSVLGFALVSLSDNQQADACLQQSLSMFEQAEDIAGQAGALYYLNHIATRLGDRTEGLRYTEQSLALYRQLDNRRSMAICLYTLGNYQIGFGDYERAREYYEESQLLHQQMDNRVGVAQCLMNQGLASFRLGDLDQAEQFSQEALNLFTKFGDQRGIGNTLNNLGDISAKRGHHRQARTYLEQSLTIRRSMGDPLKLALTLSCLANSMAALNDTTTARSHFRQALELALHAQAVGIALDILPDAGNFLAQQGQMVLAAQVLAHTEHHPDTEHYARSRTQKILQHLAQQLPPATFAQAQEQGWAKQLGSIVDTVLDHLRTYP